MKINNKLMSTCVLASIVNMPINSLATSQIPEYVLNAYKITMESQNKEVYSDVESLSDGNFIIIGATSSNTQFIQNKGGTDAVLTKYDDYGKVLNQLSLGGTSNDSFSYGTELNDGSFIVCGNIGSTNYTFNGQSVSGKNLFKFNENLELQWIKSCNFDTERRVSVTPTSDGGFIIRDKNLTKYSAEGDIDFELVSENYDYYQGTPIEIEGEGFIISKYICDSPYAGWGWSEIRKIGYDGNDISTFVLGNDEEYCSSNTDIEDLILSDNGLIISGILKDEAFIAKLGVDGSQEWIKKFENENVKKFTLNNKGELFGIIGEMYGNRTNKFVKISKDDGTIEWEKEVTVGCDLIDIDSNRNDAISVLGSNKSNYAPFINYVEVCNPVEKDTILEAVEAVENNPTEEGIINARLLVNAMPEGPTKEAYQLRLNRLMPNDMTFEKQSASANVDIYIKCENMLSLSLDTNSVTFENFNGTENLEELNAVELTVNSSLPYDVNAYLATKIENAKKDKELDKDLLKIRAHGTTDYKGFADTEATTATTLLTGEQAGNNKKHSIDLKLEGSNAVDADIYKTTIKFEVTQK